MKRLLDYIAEYLVYCREQKCLDEKTLKAYRIDLSQFSARMAGIPVTDITPDHIEAYIAELHTSFKPKTAKRKIASLKAFFHYLSFRDIITANPFGRVQVKFRAPVTLPKTIPLADVEAFLSAIYRAVDTADTKHKELTAVRDAAVMELLFATGMRISELCSLSAHNINLEDGTVLIYGKGSKERMLQVTEESVLQILRRYYQNFEPQIRASWYFFPGDNGQPLSDQIVRRSINKYAKMAGIDQHITPHMFRHTFATGLLDNDVDIRYIQAMLGHSSISTTQIYTHVSMEKQREILSAKHPRNSFNIKS